MITNFDKTIIFIGVWFIVFDMLTLPINGISLFNALSFCSIIIFIIKKRSLQNIPTFFWTCIISASISHILTNLFSGNPHWPTSILRTISNYLFPIILWNSLKNKYAIQYFIHNLFIFVSLLLIYGLFETITKTNPIINWLVTNKLTTGSVAIAEGIRFGLKRIQSFLSMNGALGVCCTSNALLFIFLLKGNFKAKLKEKKYITPLFITCLYICAMLTGSRSIFLAVFSSFLYIWNKSILKNKWTYIFFLTSILILPFIQDYFGDVFRSITDTDSVGGSSTEMREGQLELSLYFLQQNPIFGNGIGYTFSYVTKNFQEMYGAESIWFSIMIDQGLIGIFSYLFIIITSIQYCLKKHIYVGIFIIIAFIIAKTFSSIPGISESYFLIYLVLLDKIISENKKQKINNKNGINTSINYNTCIQC